MRLLGYNKRQQRLLGLFPDDRLAFNHNKPSAPAYWLLSGGDALHWQARAPARAPAADDRWYS